MDRTDSLRVLFCGSVDDGKSTLIGRLLHELGAIRQDERAALVPPAGGPEELSRLLDGLQAEREQNITIDVAWRSICAGQRTFLLADAPGHPQYTRNMATAASTADLAVLLVDARHGLQPQTCRHALICALFGVGQVVLAVNKLDLVDWDAAVFVRIAEDWACLARRLRLAQSQAIPVCALTGENVTRPADAAPWHKGPSLLEVLQGAGPASAPTGRGFRLPIQVVIRPNQDFRGYAGRVSGGIVRQGDRVAVLPSGQLSRIERILAPSGEVAEAGEGRSVVVTLADALDAARGHVICPAADQLSVVTRLTARMVWLADRPLVAGQRFGLRLGTAATRCRVEQLVHRMDPESLERHPAAQLAVNEIGLVTLTLDQGLVAEPYGDSRPLGGFILTDSEDGDTLGVGMVVAEDRPEAAASVQVDKAARARQKGQRPLCLWLTGLSGSGKSTLAALVEGKLHAQGLHCTRIDGDDLRHGLNRDLGFSPAERTENVRRAAECAALMVEAGLVVLVSLISPLREQRALARRIIGTGNFLEVFVDTPLPVCEARDPKGLYRKARAGLLPDFTGIGSPYEAPDAAEVHVPGSLSPEQAAELVCVAVRARQLG